MTSALSAVLSDIVELDVDSIVNAANPTLLGGGGVDGAIHYAAGPSLLEECRAIGGCPTGEARITRGYNLRARWIIHTVGPVWKGGNKNEAALLASCYRNSLRLAGEHEISTLAFPAISTGAYAYPQVPAAEIAVTTVQGYLRDSGVDMKVIFCCFDRSDFTIYRRILAQHVV